MSNNASLDCFGFTCDSGGRQVANRNLHDVIALSWICCETIASKSEYDENSRRSP
jgi:hypothetical protein